MGENGIKRRNIAEIPLTRAIREIKSPDPKIRTHTIKQEQAEGVNWLPRRRQRKIERDKFLSFPFRIRRYAPIFWVYSRAGCEPDWKQNPNGPEAPDGWNHTWQAAIDGIEASGSSGVTALRIAARWDARKAQTQNVPFSFF